MAVVCTLFLPRSDTYGVIGVATELMDITREGEKAMENMKQNSWSAS